jgi:hypothetical protein
MIRKLFDVALAAFVITAAVSAWWERHEARVLERERMRTWPT